MSESISMNANNRILVGKGSARSTRSSGRIPAIIYGGDKNNVLIDIEEKEYKKLMHQPGIYSRLIDVIVDGAKNTVLTKDIQFHPVSENPLHVDFFRVGKDSIVTVSVPVEFLNEELSPGLKSGGVLNTVRFELELECPAESIPLKIPIDLTGLVVGDSIKINSIILPEGIKPTISDRDFTIATITAASVMTETTDTEASVEETDESQDQIEDETKDNKKES